MAVFDTMPGFSVVLRELGQAGALRLETTVLRKGAQLHLPSVLTYTLSFRPPNPSRNTTMLCVASIASPLA